MARIKWRLVKDEARAMLKDGKSIEEVAQHFQRTPDSVKKALIRNGVLVAHREKFRSYASFVLSEESNHE